MLEKLIDNFVKNNPVSFLCRKKSMQTLIALLIKLEALFCCCFLFHILGAVLEQFYYYCRQPLWNSSSFKQRDCRLIST